MRGKITFVMPTRVWVTLGDTIGAEELADWFAADIQYGKSNVDDWLRDLAAVQAGTEPDGYFGAGNAHDLCSNRDYVFLQCLFVPEGKVLMTHAQARDVLAKYRAFLEHGWDDSTNPPQPFEVEYLAEGKEAERRAKQAGMDFIEI